MADRAEVAASITIAALEHTNMRPEEVVPMFRELLNDTLLVEELKTPAARPAPPQEPTEPPMLSPASPEEVEPPPEEERVVQAAAEPALPGRKLTQEEIDASHGEAFIQCLECGARLRQIKRHLSVVHHLTADAYRKRWGLPDDYPTISPAASKAYSARAKRIYAQGGGIAKTQAKKRLENAQKG